MYCFLRMRQTVKVTPVCTIYLSFLCRPNEPAASPTHIPVLTPRHNPRPMSFMRTPIRIPRPEPMQIPRHIPVADESFSGLLFSSALSCAFCFFMIIHSLSAKGTEGVMKRCAIAGRYYLLYCNCRISTLQNPWRRVAGLYSGNPAWLYGVGRPLRNQRMAQSNSP